VADELTIEELRMIARNRGLILPEEELQRLLPGVVRAKKQARELRDLLDAHDEPAVTFAAPNRSQKSA
jgi:hypothetical protein